MPFVRPVSVQLAVGEDTAQATVLEPIVFPATYVEPSAGVSLVAVPALRRTMLE